MMWQKAKRGECMRTWLTLKNKRTSATDLFARRGAAGAKSNRGERHDVHPGFHLALILSGKDVGAVANVLAVKGLEGEGLVANVFGAVDLGNGVRRQNDHALGRHVLG